MDDSISISWDRMKNTKGLEIGWKLSSLNKNPSNNVKCANCGKLFYRRGNRKFNGLFMSCSLDCKNKYQSGLPNKRKGQKSGQFSKCLNCDKLVYSFNSHLRKYCSMNCRNDDGRIFKRGQNHYRWKGGVKQNRKIDLRLRKWRRVLIKETGRYCKKCGVEEKIMYADHILPWADFPDERYKLTNGQILCKRHHDEKTREENKNRDKKGNLNDFYKSTLIATL